MGEVRSDIASSKSILVVGGGPNGVELMGNLAAGLQGKNKKLGLITRNPRLLPSMPQDASNAA